MLTSQSRNSQGVICFAYVCIKLKPECSREITTSQSWHSPRTWEPWFLPSLSVCGILCVDQRNTRLPWRFKEHPGIQNRLCRIAAGLGAVEQKVSCWSGCCQPCWITPKSRNVQKQKYVAVWLVWLVWLVLHIYIYYIYIQKKTLYDESWLNPRPPGWMHQDGSTGQRASQAQDKAWSKAETTPAKHHWSLDQPGLTLEQMNQWR